MFGMKRWLLYEPQRGLRSRVSAIKFFKDKLPQLQKMKQQGYSQQHGNENSTQHKSNLSDNSRNDMHWFDDETKAKDLGTPLEVKINVLSFLFFFRGGEGRHFALKFIVIFFMLRYFLISF